MKKLRMSFKSYVLRVLLISLIMLSFLLILEMPIMKTIQTTEAQQIPLCQHANRVPGQRCYQEFPINTPHVGYPDSYDTNELELQLPSGFIYIGHDNIVSTSNNNGAANIVRVVTKGNKVAISRTIDESRHKLEELKSKIEAYGKVTEKKQTQEYQGMVEAIQRAESELENRSRYFYSVDSNTDVVVVRATASGRCKTREPIFNKCLDSVGGWFEGYIRIYGIYVGTPGEIESSMSLIDNIRSKVNSIGYPVKITNSCNHSIKIAVTYRSANEDWKTIGWYEFKSGQSAIINDESVSVYTNNSVFYYYAESTDDSNISWAAGTDDSSGRDYEVSGRSVRMRQHNAQLVNGQFVLNLSCNN